MPIPGAVHTRLKNEASRLFTFALLFLLIYASVTSVTRRLALPARFPASNLSADENSTQLYSAELHQGTIFGLFLLVVLGLAAGYLCDVAGVPPLLGDKRWAAFFRKAAFVIILLQGGMGLNPHALLQLKTTVFLLAFIPCLVESCVVGVCASLLLSIPWKFGLMMGFVLGAVSPAICVPGMLKLKEDGYGVDKGIPSLIIAASSTDDVLAITCFSVLLSLAFAQGGLLWTIIGGPLEIFIGICYGCALGLILWVFPRADERLRDVLRIALLLSGGCLSMFGSAALSIEGAGALGCLVTALVANYGWAKHRADSEKDVPDLVEMVLGGLWLVPFQPLLFGLIGAELDVSRGASDGVIGVLLLILVLVIGLLFRTVAAFCATIGSGFDAKERLFISMAWLPKATVQAALGPVAYDTAVERGNASPVQLVAGLKILAMAVLSIVVTAPLGALLISLTGPKLLAKANAANQTPIREHDMIALNVVPEEIADNSMSE